MLLKANRSFAKTLLMMASATLLPVTVNAQDPTINSRRTPPVTRDMRYREWSLKDLEKNGVRKPEEQRLAWAQMQEDFKRIQIIDHDLTKHRTSEPALDLKFVEKAVSDINKRATRLQTNLMFPKKTATPDEKPRDDYQMSTLLSGLSGLIRRFINNPVFGDVDVLDVQAAANAKRDLERIIELSEQIKKKAQIRLAN